MPEEIDKYFHRSSREYISSIDATLYDEVVKVISSLPKRRTQAEINQDFFWLLTEKGWSYDSKPGGLAASPPSDLGLSRAKVSQSRNERSLCLSSSTVEANWRSDFAKSFDGRLVQLEVQFGKVELMFKDFCGFQIAWHERRLALGIEIVMSKPSEYFSHRKGAISGKAYFEIAKKTLPAIGLDCPIWLIGMG